MSDHEKQILEMLATGKITVDEAERLLAATQSPESGSGAAGNTGQKGKAQPKYLRVVVRPTAEGGNDEHGHVNIRVPMALIRAGIKLAAVIPSSAADQVNEALHKKGFDMDIQKVKAEDLEEIVSALSELEVDVRDKGETVRIYLE
jgi:hypothetical protein